MHGVTVDAELLERYPDLRAVGTVGGCMEPAIHAGDVLLLSMLEPLTEGRTVAVGTPSDRYLRVGIYDGAAGLRLRLRTLDGGSWTANVGELQGIVVDVVRAGDVA